MLKLEVGKKYLNRIGDVVEIVRYFAGHTYHFADAKDNRYDKFGTSLTGYSLVREFTSTSGVQPRKFKQFEYQTLMNCTEDTLRSVGLIGWELVSIDRTPFDPAIGRFYFKREIV